MLNLLKKITAVPQKVATIPYSFLRKIAGRPDLKNEKNEKKKTAMNGIK
jgi:hypothetical protein